ncbi:SprT family zinc-dependent metalloprotease [Vibrio marisflavi]|uniref:SprT family zinc-dependent metalloprotease n=1 Tax=Vibrio marisflavi TaxID=1216040 RepID=UPI003F4A4E36
MRMISPELSSKIHDKICQCIAKARRHFQYQFQIPEVSYRLRGKAAGKALLLNNQIRLNPILLMENQQAFLDEVIPHEIAHLIAFHHFGRVKPHGKEWQHIMLDVFQVTPSTTHCFNIQSVQGKTFEYSCGCSTFTLTIRRHNKVLRKQASYSCKKCTKVLKYTGVECNQG